MSAPVTAAEAKATLSRITVAIWVGTLILLAAALAFAGYEALQ